ncbi:phosphodiester glycosidase family protein [Spirulina sp. 06S082]|uniref:phosphodiester glycosidase family protein n=1 Tax=Spirulina sp. 06S082 TaxID=3110248 RepID=UPI002B1F8170|nr:phosphodiester glycosidase family protein [Spirulina sp. 06S082]MEA5468716.1 phosphodiester glycosidase family protein [Spirulina sp. 06S082]
MSMENQYRNRERSRHLRRRRRGRMSLRLGLAIAIALLTFALLISSLSMARMVFTAGDRAVPSPSPTALLVANDSPVEVASAIAIEKGDRLSLNGKTFSGAWIQWQDGDETRTGLSDTAAEAILGLELLDTEDANVQPVRWFGISQTLSVHFIDAYRYLDITDILTEINCQVQTHESILSIDFSPPRINNIEQQHQGEGGKMTISLDRPAFWQVSQNPKEGVVMLEGSNITEFPLDSSENSSQSQNLPLFSQLFPSRKDRSAKLNAKIEPGELRTKIQIDLPTGNQLQVTSTASPPQLIVDVRPDALTERNIIVAPGMRWQRRYVPSDDTRFPVTSLEFNPRNPNIALRPIWGNPRSMQGTEPLVTMGRQWQAFAAINGGFFNRDNRLPLGAIRRDGKWFSGPILNRGAIAWDDSGNVAIGRLYLRETLVTSTRQRLFVLFLNSGYLQAGIARYTSEWGAQYTPLTDNETIVLVEGDRVTQQLPGGKAGQSAFPIPSGGYLLTIRGGSASSRDLAVGTQVSLESETVPPNFGNYPQIMGAGPLLLQNGQFVLNPSGEKFSNAFNGQAASRSLIGITRQGTLIIAAIHNRPGGRGPTLNELARLALRLGMMDALNLDGGSSTSFYLGGQLVDRSAVTAARVHNGIGIYLKSANSR